MNTRKLLSIAALTLVGSTLFAGEDHSPTMLERYLDTERSAARYHNEPPAPHWTDTLKQESTSPSVQTVGFEYGQDYGTAGAIKQTSEKGLGSVSVFYRTKF